MKALLALTALVCVAAPGVALAKPAKPAKIRPVTVKPLAAKFDLREQNRIAQGDRMAVNPIPVPRGMDVDARSWTPPTVEMAVVDGGPIVALGAMGSRRKGVPKLAHIAVNWDF